MDISQPGWDDRIKEKNGKILRVAVIDIGAWDMQLVAYRDVNIGISQSKIFAHTFMIQPDDETARIWIATDQAGQADVVFSGTSVRLLRKSSLGSLSDYRSTAINRGWITVWYTD